MSDKVTNKAPHPPHKHHTEFSLLPKVINGGLAGMVGVTVVFPIDLVKTRLQNQTIGPNGEKQYANMWDCFKKTYKAEGYFGMYRGSAVNILLITPEKSVKLAANDLFRYHLSAPDGSVTIPRQMIAGIFVGLAQTVISTPMDLLKIAGQDEGRIIAQLKAEGKPPIKSTSAKDLAYKIVKQKGIFGLYQGVVPTALRETWFSVVYFPIFFSLNELMYDEKGKAPLWWSFLGGMFSGTMAAIAVNPIDVVKTRMQTLTKGKHDKVYKGTIDSFVRIYREEGINAFSKGIGCRIIIIAPLFAIAQTVYYVGVGEHILQYLGYM